MRDLKNKLAKDFDKFLSVSVQVYLFVLIVACTLKLAGLNCFGLQTQNPTILKITNFITKYHLINVWYFITLYIYTYCIVAIAVNNRQVKTKVLIYTIVGAAIKVFETYYCDQTSTALLDIFYLYLICFATNKNYKFLTMLKRTTIIIIVTTLYQLVSAATRAGDMQMYDYNFIQLIILDLDYILLCLLTIKIYFSERSVKVCTMEVGYSLQKKIHLKNLLTNLLKHYSNFKKQDRQYKASVIIYSILSIFWNIFTLVVVIFIAMLNNTLIECLFIMTSFWLTKSIFGRAFHLDSMLQCFVVSNVSYYVINRVTTPAGISIFVPVLLGVGLSYFTSRLVKNTYKPLYKGMPEDLFNETILQVTDKDSKKYLICYDYFIKNKSAIALSRKYNYTDYAIRQIANRVNDKIKRLSN